MLKLRKIIIFTLIFSLLGGIICLANIRVYQDEDGEWWQAKVDVGPIYPGETVWPEIAHKKETSETTGGVIKIKGPSAYAPMTIRLKSSDQTHYTQGVNYDRSYDGYFRNTLFYITSNNKGICFKVYATLSSTALVSSAWVKGYMTP